MQEILIGSLTLFTQTLSFYFVYLAISKRSPSLLSLFLFFMSIVLGNVFLGYFFFIPGTLCLYLYGYFTQRDKNRNLLYFYSIYSIFSTSLVGYIFVNIFDRLNLSHLLAGFEVFLFQIIVIPGLSFVCNKVMIRLMRNSLLFLENQIELLNQKFLLLINVLLSVCCAIQFLSYWIEVHYFNGDSPIREYLIFFFALTIILLLRYLNAKTKELDNQRIQQLKDTQLADLSSYVHQIEAIYGELRSFRHDYHNMLISLSESIKSKDISLIEDTYNKILNHEDLVIDKEHYSLTRLNNLKTLPIKGVISAHVIQAWQKNIPVRLEVEDVIENESIDILDYVRVVSNLLDNAIEAAEKDAYPFLNIAFFKNNSEREIQLIIENSCSENSLNIVKIFQKGYSTKGTNRGLGLATVQAILQNYQNLSLQTEFQAGVFRQTFVIREVIQL
ncbi:MAG: GHKL domain-containing protein [Enterococcus gilvus]|nr:GHKL domain-containing protein [Enterococcus gilvus]